ncbi:MAG: hypothetical protein FWD00_04825 [Clostridiales bacterium]|nr:hypothetical protein [Clostridiales bacterium]
MRFLFWGILGKRIKAIPYMMRDKSVSKGKKALIIGGIIYLFLPFKFLPAVFVWGALSNIIIWLWIILYLKDELDKYWVGEKQQDFSKKYKNKTVIDDVDFEIKDEKEE